MRLKITSVITIILLILCILIIDWNSAIGTEHPVNSRSKNNENAPPELSEPKMTPSSGDIYTLFSFTVHYYDVNEDEPKFIQLMTGNKFYNMELMSGELAWNGTYGCNVTLIEGEHTYYFITSDNLHTVITENLTTPYIKKVAESTTEESGGWLIWIVFIIVVIVLIIIFITIQWVKKRSKSAQPEGTISIAERYKTNPSSSVDTEPEEIKKLKQKMGISKETGVEYRCYKCDTVISPDFDRCPKCGEELSF